MLIVVKIVAFNVFEEGLKDCTFLFKVVGRDSINFASSWLGDTKDGLTEFLATIVNVFAFTLATAYLISVSHF